jgi:hypothetical protein
MNHGGQRPNCEEFSEALSAYLDGELSAEERSQLETHLEGCPRCQEELKSLRAVSSLVTSLPEVTPSPAFLSALGRGFEKRRRWLRPIPLFKGDLIPALAAAAVILISVTMVLVVPSVSRLRRAVAPYEAVPPAGKPESPAPSSAPPAGGAAVGTEAERERLPAPAAPPTERGLMELAREKAGPPAAAAVPYKGEGQQQSILAAGKDGGAATARDERAGAYAPAPGAAPAKAKESEADRLMPMGNVMAPPGAGGEARVRAAPPSAVATKAPEAMAGEPAPTVAAKEAPPAQQQMAFRRGQGSQGPAFLLVTLRCTDNQAGAKAFTAALDEFATLRSPMPQLAAMRPMSPEEEQRYLQVLRELHESPSPDVVAFRELIVPAADVDVVQGVFVGQRDLTFADPAADAARLRDVVSARRTEVAARRPVSGARAPEAAPSAEALGSTVLQTKAEPAAAPLVDVVVVLRGQPARPSPSPKQ